MASPERFSHSSSLFITDLGPMRFYVRPGPLKRQLAPLITHGGGIMCRVQEPGAFLLSEPGQTQGIQYISSTYITDCVRSNRRLSPRKYRMLSRDTAGPGHNCNGAQAPDKIHRVEGRSPDKVKARQGVNTGGEGATLCKQSPDTGGPREVEAQAALESNPTGNGPAPSLNNAITTAPVKCDPVTSTPDPCADAIVLCNPTASPPLDPCLTPKTPASCDSRPVIGGKVQNSGVEPIVRLTTSDEEMENTGERNAVEEDQHQAVLRQNSPLRIAPGPVGRLPFSMQEDIAILLYVRKNETAKKSVTGTLLWKELEEKQLLKRTWQAMKSRYTKYIVRHKHRYRQHLGAQVTSKTDPAETSRELTNQQRGLSSTSTTLGLISQHHDLPLAENSLKSSLPHEDTPHTAGLGVEETSEGACTDLNDDGGFHSGGSTVIRRLRSANRKIVNEVSVKPVQENGDSSSEAEGSGISSKGLPNPQEKQETGSSEDLQIFEIANMEFEVDDEDSNCKVKVPGISLKDFVMGEDSISADTQMQVDDVISSPDLSDSEGLHVSLTDMMSEFKLDICQVTQALLKNSGEVGSTRHFLRVGRRPDGFPIWEHEDDVDLQRNDPVVQAQLARKYGADSVAKRAAFLAS
ncbi:telomeric repeat-binding factor 2-interacting protein 1 [Hyla sarda]|uniref:telomeric repeat-binding factor 2-interacting protein 1 n=1 Tax=Hyla sarda TaxID=327740 RepID=UPI0024C240C4|nr:telomeric repeat-binding factor 2-interacting protein 1 [Hyla sarda]